MKKLIVVPVIAMLAAAGAASAAGFTGGVTSGPLQVGQTNDLECADSAQIIEWGYNDHLATPNVVNVRVQLNGANCAGQSISVLPLKADGTQFGPRAAGRIPSQAPGTQTVRVSFDSPMDAEQLKSVRVSVDPGYAGEPDGTIG
jgi:hypothetical protein